MSEKKNLELLKHFLCFTQQQCHPGFFGGIGKYSFPWRYLRRRVAGFPSWSRLMFVIPFPGWHTYTFWQNLRWTTAVKWSCVRIQTKASPDMFWYNLCDAQKTNSLHHSCSVSWFISSAGYFNCQSVANCQCNAPLTAALHTFPSPRWPMLNSIFKFRRFETASLCKKKKKRKRK